MREAAMAFFAEVCEGVKIGYHPTNSDARVTGIVVGLTAAYVEVRPEDEPAGAQDAIERVRYRDIEAVEA